jgi:16S rRNA (guanine527-N7)-methyltransferase
MVEKASSQTATIATRTRGTAVMNQQQQLEKYESLVQLYSKTLDLSSPRMLEKFHIAIENSKKYAEFVPASARVIDIGSGVGLPGIPLAILRPDITITLCEIRQKRAAFLERVVSTLSTTNAQVFHGDVKQIKNQKFDAVTAQSVGTLAHLYKLCKNALTPTWVIISNKGEKLELEIAEIQKITDVLSFKTEQLDENATIVIVYGGQE